MDNFALSQQTWVWLTDSVLKPSYQTYVTYLVGRGYSSWSVRKYLCGVAHFAHWLRKRRVKLSQIDEAQVRRFLDEHLPRCACPLRTPRCRNHVGPALKHRRASSRLRWRGITSQVRQSQTTTSSTPRVCALEVRHPKLTAKHVGERVKEKLLPLIEAAADASIATR